MNPADLVAILTMPLVLGMVFPQLELALVLLLLKLFDWWSTAYIVGNGGEEKASMCRWLINHFGLRIGVAIDLAIVAAAAWFCYPYPYLLGAVVAWYAYWMYFQLGEVRKTKNKL